MKRNVILALIVMLALGAACKKKGNHDNGKGGQNSAKEVLTEVKVIKGYNDPGTPDEFDRVGYVRYYLEGQSNVPVLIIVSGYVVDVSWFDRMARDLAARKGMEVWTINRRETFIEKRDELEKDIETYITNPPGRRRLYRKMKVTANYRKGKDEYIERWGYVVQMEDMKKVVNAAKKISDRVFIGGWSDGVEYVMTYANYKFGKKFGSRDLAGLVFLDENPEWGYLGKKMARLDKQIARQERLTAAGNIYMKYSPSLAIHTLALELALREPDRPSPLAKKFHLPRAIKEQGITNRALLGWLYDADVEGYSRRRRGGFAYLLRSGDLYIPEKAGKPVTWKSHKKTAEVTDIATYIEARKAPGIVWELFYPRKVISDYFRIAKCDYDCPDFNIYENPKNKLPVFYILTSTNIGKISLAKDALKAKLSGLKFYMKKTGITWKDVTLHPLYSYAHADMYFAEKAPAELYGPLYKWIVEKSK